MADVYWFGNGGNWSDHTNHWSNNSGNSPASLHGAAPGTDDNVHFDANSFSATSQTVTVDATANCLDMDWTGATNTPDFRIASGRALNTYGNVTFIAAMTWTYVASTSAWASLGSGIILTNGLVIACGIFYPYGTILGDDFALNSNVGNILYNSGTFDTGGFTVTIKTGFTLAGAGVKTLILGASTINSPSWNYSGTNLTLPANTATINCSGNFAGGGITTYNIVNLTGATSTVSGSNTFATLALPSGTTQTITFTDGTTQTATTFTLSGSAGHVHTLAGTSTAGWALTKSGGGNVVCDYLSVSYSTVT